MSALREAAQQALEALKFSTPNPRSTDDDYAEQGWKEHIAAITALRAALAQQDEPVAWLQPKTVDGHLRPDLGHETCSKDDYGAFAVYTAPPQRKQAEPVEPVAWVNQANLASARLTRDRGGQGDTHTRSETRSNYHGVPLYTAPPQRKPLPKQDQHCVDVPGYGLMAVRLVRAVERAHGIKEN